MPDSNLLLIEKIRRCISSYTPEQFTLKEIAKDLEIPLLELKGVFKSESEIVEEILKFEYTSLETLFLNTAFENDNAIDDLLKVSRELSRRFGKILPSFNFDLKKDYPELHQKYFRMRNDLIFEKISGNIQMGIQQDVYRKDLSTELVSRIYISRLIDLYNPDFFPPAQFSFNTLFDVMFDTFIRGISTEEGVKHFEKKVKCLKFVV